MDQYDEKTADGFMFRLTGTPNQADGNGSAVAGGTKIELCNRLIPGSTNAKAAFGTKVHSNTDAAKTAMGVAKKKSNESTISKTLTLSKYNAD